MSEIINGIQVSHANYIMTLKNCEKNLRPSSYFFV